MLMTGALFIRPMMERNGRRKTIFVLMTGMIVDRYGFSDGRFLSPDGLAKEKRALPNTNGLTERTRYRVKRDVVVSRGTVLPWFGQEGNGEQFKLSAYVKSLPEDFEELR